MTFQTKPIQGVGIGLRAEHFETILSGQLDVPWFEALSENYIHQGERAIYHLEKVRENYPISLHGVSLSIGSSDPLNWEYLKALKTLIKNFSPGLVSDHLCWASLNKRYVPDLLPLPYTEEALNHVVARIKTVQDFLEQRILIENVSSYISYNFSDLTEWEFITQVATNSDCDLLLDVNNVYVSSQNHNFSPLEFIQALPIERVKEIHLAGFEDKGTHLLDTHGKKIHAPVWDLYAATIKRYGQVPTLIEWDMNIPSFDVLLEERVKAKMIFEAIDETA
jgi:uncharacterized protein